MLLLATWTGLALLGVVAVVVGFAVHQLRSGQTPELDEWPLRGSLAGDEALLDRAEQTLRGFGGVDDVHPLYAERSSGLAVNTVLVVMAGRTDDDRPVVAFVTSPATTGTPTTDRLFVRAVGFPEERPAAVGFVAARQDPADTTVPDGGSLAFALAGPKHPVVAVHTTVIDRSRPGPERPGETFWRVLPRGAGAWNTTMSTGQSHEEPTRPAAGVHDPATTLATVSKKDGTVIAGYRAPAAGDVITSSNAMLGVVTDTTGRMEASPTAWAAWGAVSTESSNIPGTLTSGTDGTLLFTATGPGEVTDGERLVFTSAADPGVVIRVGDLAKAGGGWRVERGVDLDRYQLSTAAVTP